MRNFQQSVLWQPIFEGEEIDTSTLPMTTEVLEFYMSKDNLFSSAKWVFSAGSSMIDSGLLNTGRIVNFEFYSKNHTEPIVIRMGVLSFKNGPGANSKELGQFYDVMLVSPWYFTQKVKSKAYRGKISSIIEEAIVEDHPEISYFIDESWDEVQTRYRTNQTISSFIENRLKNSVKGKDSSLSFMYTDIYERFMVSSCADIDSKYELYLAIDPSSEGISAFSSWLEDDILFNRVFFLNKIILLSNRNTSKQTLWAFSNPKIVYNTRSLGITNKVEPSKLYFTSKKRFSMITELKNTNKDITKVITDDSLNNYEEIVNKITNAINKERADSFRMELTGNITFDIVPGRTIYFYITSSETASSIFSQKYLVSEVVHTFVRNQATTTITITKPALDFTYEKDVLKFNRISE